MTTSAKAGDNLSAKNYLLALPRFYCQKPYASPSKPVITTNSAGCKEVVENGKTGFLCKVKDAADLAFCMERVLQLSPQAYSQMGLAGRRKMEQEFDVKLVVKQYVKALQDLTLFNPPYI